MRKQSNTMTTSMNERTHFFIKITFHTLFSKGLMLVVYERWVEDRDRLLHIDSKFFWSYQHFFRMLAGLLNRGSLRATSPQSASWFSRWHLVPNWLQLQLELELELIGTDSSRLWHLVIFFFDVHLIPVGVRICNEFNHVHRSRWYSDIFDRMHLFRCSTAYLHWCISWLTARWRFNMLNNQLLVRSGIFCFLVEVVYWPYGLKFI